MKYKYIILSLLSFWMVFPLYVQPNNTGVSISFNDESCIKEIKKDNNKYVGLAIFTAFTAFAFLNSLRTPSSDTLINSYKKEIDELKEKAANLRSELFADLKRYGYTDKSVQDRAKNLFV